MASHFSSPTTLPSFTSAWDWKLLGSSSGILSFSGRENKRRRRRCTFNKYFTETGAFLLLGAFVLVALPPWTHCRPTGKIETQNISTNFNVYARSSDDSSTSLLPPSSGSALPEEDEVSAPGRFEFRRKISPGSSNEPDADNIKNKSSSRTSNNSNNDNNSDEILRNVHTFKVIQGPNENKDNAIPSGNSSMIVHVIVTSSSSSSSGSVELDETDNNNSRQDSGSIRDGDFHYTVAITEDDGEGESGLLAEPSSESHVSTMKSSLPSATTTTTMILRAHPSLTGSANEKQSFPHSFHIVDDGTDGQLELKKLPKSENDTLDIFSAFYRAFSETAPLSTPGIQPLASVAEQDKVSLLPAASTTDGTVTAFKLPPRSDFRQRPSSFQLFQQRRRLQRTRQLLEKRPSTFSPLVTPEHIEGDSNKNLSTPGSSSVEETARKLEFLAKKLEKSEQDDSFRGQQDKILVVSSSSLSSLITTTQVPFLPSHQPSSANLSSFTPPKIAVSVTHSKSVVASAPAAPSTAQKKEEEAKQEVVIEGVIKNAKSETTFSASVQEKEKEQIHGTYSYFTRPRPLIKSLSRNRDSDQERDTINNKNRGNNNIFPRNFSTHGRAEEGGNGVPRKIYGGESGAAEGSNTAVNGHKERISTFERSSNNNHNNKANEENIRIQDRHNIISPSQDGSDGTLSPALPKNSPFNIPKAQPSSFIESMTVRPSSHRKKITRTVSGEIGDPSSYFNINVNYGPTPSSSQKASSTAKPRPVNWQQPEKNWGEPAQIWSTPAKVWGEPERIWSEPAKVWGSPAKVWTKKLDDEMMQSDQPSEGAKGTTEEDDTRPQGAFVILGDDEGEGDSIDGDLGRPLMLHHFTVPPNKQKETVSVSTSVSSSTSSDNKSNFRNSGPTVDSNSKFSKTTAASHSPPVYHSHLTQNAANPSQPPSGSISSSVVPNSSSSSDSTNSDSDSDSDSQNKKTGKKFGYVIEGANVRKYRVEERTPDGYIVGEYGVLNNQNAFLRGVRYTADGTINPRLIHEALMKFLSLRR